MGRRGRRGHRQHERRSQADADAGMDRKREIIQIIETMAGKYSAYEIFTDWIRALSLAIENSTHLIHDKLWHDREQLYIDTMRKYTDPERTKLCEMTACLVDTLEDGPFDVLGDVYMKSGMGSKVAGQFFTPSHLSVLTARLGTMEQIRAYKAGEISTITVNEPSCGGGAMIIAAAQVLKEAGINYQTVMDVVAQDLDWKGVYMCHVQLSLLGINAICVQGDTLGHPYDQNVADRSHILQTPRRAGMLV